MRLCTCGEAWYDGSSINHDFMTELTEKEVRHVAFLARIGVTDDDVAQYQKDLSGVLAYFEELNAVDTTDVAPIGHITGMTNVFRNDVVQDVDEDTRARIMASMPETREGYIKVKSLF